MSEAGGSRPDPRSVAAELQSSLLGADGIEPFLLDVTRFAVGAVSDGLSCGISVQVTSRSPMLGAASDEFAQRMDAVQYESDDGPCLTCLRTGVLVSVEDIAADTRWPAFTRRGRQVGAGTSLSVPMVVQQRSIGALNLYGRAPGGLAEPDRDRARQFAAQAAGAVALAVRLRDREDHARHLETALRSRSTIDQAIGIVMARAGISADQAFDVLRVRSQHRNLKLRDIAAQIIAEVTGSPS